MRKFKLLVSALVVLVVPAMAQTESNRNMLGKGPVMERTFVTAPSKAEVPEEKKDDVEQLRQASESKVDSLGRFKAAPAGVELPPVVASVYDLNSGAIGMYRLPAESGGELESVTDKTSSYYGGARSGNLYYACHDGHYDEYWSAGENHGHKIQAYDINTWEPVGNEYNFTTYRAPDLAIDPSNGLGYAYCDYGSVMFRLYRFDLSHGLQDVVNSSKTYLSSPPAALCFDEEGTLYSVNKAGVFGTIDKENDEFTAIADLGVGNGNTQYNWSLDYDPDSSSIMFMYNNAQGANLYRIDPKSGKATLLADFPGKCITSIFVEPSSVDDNAPAEVSGLTASFADGSLSGTVSFTMPELLVNGDNASGSAQWQVYDNTVLLASGNANYGAQVNTPVAVENIGLHTFIVTATNEAGEGKKARFKMWVGPDIPVAPEKVTASYDEDQKQFNVSWTAVTEGFNGGYVNPAEVVYDVVRMPGEIKVAENINATSVTESYETSGIESFTFEVTAKFKDAVSAPTVSEPVISGYMTLPYDMSNIPFDNLLDNWTIVDSNEDGRTWDTSSWYKDYKIYYTYSSSNDADDWAITPPMKALAGNEYKVYAKFMSNSTQWTTYPEKVEVKAGYGASADAMTIELLPETIITKNDPGEEFEFSLIPPTDGKIFIGFHALSEANQYYLKLVDLKITAPINDAAPVAPAITELVADRSGELSVSGKVAVPKTAVDGSTLASISKVEVARNGVVVSTIENPVPGSTVEFCDNTMDKDDVYSYVAYAYNDEYGSAPSEIVKTFVGVNSPSKVTDLKIVRSSENPTQAIASWTAPEVDAQGYPLNGKLTYKVEVYPDNAYFHGNKTYTDVEGTTFTFEPTFDTGRDHGFVYVKVSAVNNAGTSWTEKSSNIYVGEALTLPFKESFPNYSLEHPWGDGESNGPQIASISDDERAISWQQFNGWNRLMDASFDSSDGAQDGDNGFAGMFGWPDEYTELLSPVINLSGVENPVLTFYTYNWFRNNFRDPNILNVYVETADGQRHTVVDKVVGEYGEIQDWMYVLADLSQFKGQDVQLIFKGTVIQVGDRGYNWVLIDNVRIEDVAKTDLAASHISAPVQAVPGEEFTVSARITNFGTDDVNSYKAILTLNGSQVDAKQMEKLASADYTYVEFDQKLGVQSTIGNVYTVSVEADGDTCGDNDRSSEVTVARNLQVLPEPQSVYFNDKGLEWSEPDFDSAVPALVLEDFESYPCVKDLEVTFLTEAGDWIFIDRDQLPIGGMIDNSTSELLSFPGIPNYSTQSWWVQSRMFDRFNDTYYGYDNSMQYLANMYVTNQNHTEGMKQDDWAITPELCGREQLVTLWARSYSFNYLETVEFLYSTGSVNPDDFKLIRRIENLPGDWTQYACVVPDGAKRFAIRGCSYGVYGTAQTFVDNVAFYPASGEKQNLELIGYNVYSDQELLNATPVQDLRYVSVPAGDRKLAVSAVYTSGESRAVEAIEGSGVENITSANVRIETGNGEIRISGLNGLAYSVVSASGVTYANGSGSDVVEVSVSSGVYIVSLPDRNVKVVVK